MTTRFDLMLNGLYRSLDVDIDVPQCLFPASNPNEKRSLFDAVSGCNVRRL